MQKNQTELNPTIFRAYDIRGIVDVDITLETARIVGKSVGTFIQNREGNRLIVGMDNRPSSEALKAALAEGLLSTGCEVMDIGLSTSPLMYQAVVDSGYDGGVIVTASHNPKEYNGFKVVGRDAYPIAADEMVLLRDVAMRGEFRSGSGSITTYDPVPRYFEKIQEPINLERKIRVVVDAGNAVAGKFAPSLLRSLGCEVVELYCELDGTFPNHLPNPEHETNVLDLEDKVIETGAEIGLALDGDGDRLGIIDEKGHYRVSDYAIILLARDFLSRWPGAKVLIDVKSSQNVIDEIKQHDGVPVLYKTGHSLIKKKMRADGIMLGGELSGHFYVFEDYYPFDDALFAAARILQVLSKDRRPFSEHFSALPTLYSTRIIELPCADSEKFRVVHEVTKLFSKEYEVNDIDGARVSFPDGWAIVRASNTTPMLTFRAEAESKARLEWIKEEVYRVLEQFPAIELDAALEEQH